MKLICFVILFVSMLLANAQHDPHWWSGRSVIVHLFEWKYRDIAEECENFLAPNGFAGVQTSVPLENIITPGRPWHERYQPVSYKFETRSGNEAAFLDMSRRCNAVGIRIYPDIIINHMAAGNGRGWTAGTGGSQSRSDTLEFPAVPFGPNDFNQPQCAIDSCYCNAANIRNCNLVGLTDLALSKQYVRDQAVAMMDRLIDLGVAGFRVDTVKVSLKLV
jgi:alpha-amylase